MSRHPKAAGLTADFQFTHAFRVLTPEVTILDPNRVRAWRLRVNLLGNMVWDSKTSKTRKTSTTLRALRSLYPFHCHIKHCNTNFPALPWHQPLKPTPPSPLDPTPPLFTPAASSPTAVPHWASAPPRTHTQHAKPHVKSGSDKNASAPPRNKQPRRQPQVIPWHN